MKKCPHCGKLNINRANFCGYCGKEISFPTAETVKVNENDAYLKSLNKVLQKGSAESEPEDFEFGAQKQNKTLWFFGGGVLILSFFVFFLVTNYSNIIKFDGVRVKNLNPNAIIQPSSTLTVTNTKMPTGTHTPSATTAPTFTPTITSTPLPPAGIGVSRNSIESVFYNLGYFFHEADKIDNQPRVIGESTDKYVSIELWGPPPELLKVTLYMTSSFIGNEDLVHRAYINKLLKIITPQWERGTEWVINSIAQLKKADSNKKEKQIIIDLVKITIQIEPTLDVVMLSFEGIYSLE